MLSYVLVQSAVCSKSDVPVTQTLRLSLTMIYVSRVSDSLVRRQRVDVHNEKES